MTGYTIKDAPGSSYSLKIRALLRYRRIPHIWQHGTATLGLAAAKVKAPVIPVVEYPDGSFHDGSTPLIGSSTHAVLYALEAHVVDRHCLFGKRPSLAELGIYGQLSQLGVDPTPEAIMRQDYPYRFRWLLHVDDMSGIDGDSDAQDAPCSSVVKQLLTVAAAIHAPFLLANVAAIEAGAQTFSITAIGLPYTQGTFKYQVKCLAELRTRYAALDGHARVIVEPLLKETHCLEMLK